MIEVLGRRNSLNVQKVMWTIGELDLPFTRRDVGGSFGYPQDYAQLNPHPLVPTIRDGGLTLWESNACVRYLARTYGRGTLWPDDPVTLAHADQWMDWQKSDLSRFFFPLFIHRIRFAPDKQNPARIERGIEGCKACFALLDEHLSRQPYVTGEHFTMGDIPVGAMAYRYLTLDIERLSIPHVEAWYRRLCARPAYRHHNMIAYGRNPDEWLAEEKKNAGLQ